MFPDMADRTAMLLGYAEQLRGYRPRSRRDRLTGSIEYDFSIERNDA